MEYRMRAFQGAFHANPDYMHWYGWGPMKEAAARIRDEAGRMREAAAVMDRLDTIEARLPK